MTAKAENRLRKIQQFVVYLRIVIIIGAGFSLFGMGIDKLITNEIFSEKSVPISKAVLLQNKHKKIKLNGLNSLTFMGSRITVGSNPKTQSRLYPSMLSEPQTNNQIMLFFFGSAIESVSSSGKNIGDFLKNKNEGVFEILPITSLPLSEKNLLIDSYIAQKEALMIKLVDYDKHWWSMCIAGTLVSFFGFYLIILNQITKKKAQWKIEKKVDVSPFYSFRSE